MNTNLFLDVPTNIVVLRSSQPDISFSIMIIIGVLLLLKLFSMAYVLFKIEYGKYKYRKNIQLKEKGLTKEKLISIYFQVRDKYNANQLEFPFVKAIDDEYVCLRYNLNEDTES
jgi:hypothetical protein